MLKLILAVSADGYLARGPRDDMSWTGRDDKAAFRLLTSVGGRCAVGARSWALMPAELPGRSLVPLTQDGRLVYHGLDRTGACPEASTTVGRFAHANPAGWLLGGPSLAHEALDLGLVDQVYLCRSPVVLHGEQSAFRAEYADTISPWLMSRGERGNAGVPWSRRQRIRVGDVTVDAWSRMDAR